MAENKVTASVSVDGYDYVKGGYVWDIFFDYGVDDVLADAISDITGWCVSDIQGIDGLATEETIDDVADGDEVVLTATLDDDGELDNNVVTVRVTYYV